MRPTANNWSYFRRCFISNNFKGGRGRRKERGPRTNDQIRIPECRLMSDEQQYGVVSIDKAREIAEELGVDLIEIAPTAKPPVVKLMDYGKFKYEQQKKAAEAKKKQAKVQLKEIQLRPNIEAHDLETKLKKAYKFLENGDKVKFVMQFRGREMAYKDMGKEKFESILAGVCEEASAAIESPIKMMGNRIITIVAPVKKK